jgi:uncharacterized protein (TIGR00255 family)
MNSMTGYGKGAATKNGYTVTVELKSVNNRYLEISSKFPKSLAACDETIRAEIQKAVKRGSVDVFFNCENASAESKKVTVDLPLAREYVTAAKKLRTEFFLEDDFQTSALLRSPDVLKVEFSKDDPRLLEELVREAVRGAIKGLNAMRLTEGKTLRQNLSDLIAGIAGMLKDVSLRAPQVAEEYRAKLNARIREALGAVEPDEARLLNETAYFADKADISEEISRLGSHMSQFTASIGLNEPVGRKLDFIAQEINREVNTIGSKSNDLTLTNLVVEMKNELEKVKEQIRNVE